MGGTYAPLRDTVMYTTSYRIGKGITSLIDATNTMTGIGIYRINLTNNSEYITGSTFNLTICYDTTTINADDCFNRTITYNAETITRILTKPEIDDKTERVILSIMIIVITAATGILLTSINAGIVGFIIGCTIASFWQLGFALPLEY